MTGDKGPNESAIPVMLAVFAEGTAEGVTSVEKELADMARKADQHATLLDALRVIVLTPATRQWLASHDRTALEQAERAIWSTMSEDERAEASEPQGGIN